MQLALHIRDFGGAESLAKEVASDIWRHARAKGSTQSPCLEVSAPTSLCWSHQCIVLVWEEPVLWQSCAACCRVASGLQTDPPRQCRS